LSACANFYTTNELGYFAKIKIGFGIIDAQGDFLEADQYTQKNGSLSVQGSSLTIGPITNFKNFFVNSTFLTMDHHIPGDITFASTHGVPPFSMVNITYTFKNGTNITKPEVVWPDHCVVNTSGYQLHPGLELNGLEPIFKKGFGNVESYSAVYNVLGEESTGLLGWLKGNHFKVVITSGLARDYCVGGTAVDLAKNNFIVFVDEAGTAAVDAFGSNERMTEQFKFNRVLSIDSRIIVSNIMRYRFSNSQRI
jgi:nicotinamidase/pyrazinamidase